MLKKIMMIMLIATVILFVGCDSTNDDNNNDEITIDMSKPVTLFSYFYEGVGPLSDIQFLNGDKIFNPFLDNVNRSYPSLSLDKTKIVYLYNFMYVPMYGPYGSPSVKYYDIENNTDIEILPETGSETILYLNPIWISESMISVNKIDNNTISIIIVNLDGELIAEKEIDTDSGVEQFLSPDNNYLVLKTDVVKLYDIDQNLITDINSDIKFSSKPIFYDDKFYFNTESGCKFFDLSLMQMDSLDIPEELCFINDKIKITENNDCLKLFDFNLNLIDSIVIEDCNYYGSLQSYQDSTFYFYGENDLIEDEGAVYKVDFNDLSIDKISNLGEDHFIIHINSFD